MNPFRTPAAIRRTAAAAATVLMASGCAYVSQNDFDSEMTRVRAEIQQGDTSVENRLGQRMDLLESQLSSLETQLNELSNDFEVTVERLETAVRFNTPIHFAFDDDRVNAEHHAVLNRLANVLGSYFQDAVITVEGFTDSAGSADYNQRLGQRRAEAVSTYLTEQGLPSDRMRAVSYGKTAERQIIAGAYGPGQEGWQNRRVAVVIDFAPQEGSRPLASAAPLDERHSR